MGTNKGALITLNTFLWTPYRNRDCCATFFKRCTAYGECPIFHTEDIRDFEFISFLAVHDILNLYNKFRRFLIDRLFFIYSIFPTLRNINTVKRCNTVINRSVIHVDDLFALTSIGGENCIFEILNGIIYGNNICKLKETGLHYHVEPPAKP